MAATGSAPKAVVGHIHKHRIHKPEWLAFILSVAGSLSSQCVYIVCC